MTNPIPGTQEWLDLVIEEVVDPARPIVDPHHHLWPAGGALPYGLDELHSDVDGTSSGGGHRIVRTVFVECCSKTRRLPAATSCRASTTATRCSVRFS